MKKAFVFTSAGVKDYYTFTAITIHSLIDNTEGDYDIIWLVDDIEYAMEHYGDLPVIFDHVPRLTYIHRGIDVEFVAEHRNPWFLDEYYQWCDASMEYCARNRLGYDRLVAIDSDCIILSDLNVLFDMDMSTKAILAHGRFHDPEGTWPIYNAGVVMFNTALFKEWLLPTPHQWVEAINDDNPKYDWMDENPHAELYINWGEHYMIEMAREGFIGVLPRNFNAFACPTDGYEHLTEGQRAAIFAQFSENAILHYMESSKPWCVYKDRSKFGMLVPIGPWFKYYTQYKGLYPVIHPDFASHIMNNLQVSSLLKQGKDLFELNGRLSL